MKSYISSGTMSQTDKIRTWWRHAFAIEDPNEGWSSEERELAERLAEFVVRRRLGAVALMTLEAGRPFSFLGSQALTFLSPFATLVFSTAEYERFTRLLERRRSVDLIVEAIARRESEKHG